MTEHIQERDSIRGERLIFEGRKVGRVQVIQLKRQHKGQRVKLNDGICWIERTIRFTENI